MFTGLDHNSLLGHWFSEWVSETSAVNSWNLLEIQSFIAHPRPIESRTLAAKPSHVCFNKAFWWFWWFSSQRTIVMVDHLPNRTAALASFVFYMHHLQFSWNGPTSLIARILLSFPSLFRTFGRGICSGSGSECCSALHLLCNHSQGSCACLLGQGILSCVWMLWYVAQHRWKELEISDIQQIPAKEEFPQRRCVLDYRECDSSWQWDLLLPDPIPRPNEW